MESHAHDLPPVATVQVSLTPRWYTSKDVRRMSLALYALVSAHKKVVDHGFVILPKAITFRLDSILVEGHIARHNAEDTAYTALHEGKVAEADVEDARQNMLGVMERTFDECQNVEAEALARLLTQIHAKHSGGDADIIATYDAMDPDSKLRLRKMMVDFINAVFVDPFKF